jgi:hypothetical protein
MKEKREPDNNNYEVKTALAARLHEFFQLVETGIELVCYYEAADVFCFKKKDHSAFFVSASMRRVDHFMEEVFRKLRKHFEENIDLHQFSYREIHYLDGTVKKGGA